MTISEMRVALDLELDILNSDQFNRLESPIKDYFLNKAVLDIVNDVVTSANKPDENKRVPTRALTVHEILKKYNTIRTLIKIESLTLITNAKNTDSIVKYNLPASMLKFEGSASNVTTVATPNVTKSIQNLIPDDKSIYAFNDDPFGGGKQFMATSLIGTTLYLFNLGRYTVNSTDAIYIANPATLTDGQDCDLPTALHSAVVERAARDIAVTRPSENYQTFRANIIEKNK